MTWSEFWEMVKNFFVNNWQTIVAFLVTLIVGFIVVKIIIKIVSKVLSKSKLDGMAAKFLTSILKIFLYIIYLIALLSLLGIPTTSLVALVSVGALAISLAIQDVISNFASGIEIVVTKPFVEGDFVEINGQSGNVDRITIINTRIITPDNKVITIPNNTITTSSVTNYSTQPTRRLDIVMSAAYGTDVDKVKSVVMGVVEKHEQILKDPAPMVRLAEHNSSSLDFTVRVWVNNSDYWNVNFDLKEELLAAFNDNEIEIPFDQLDVHVTEQPPARPAEKPAKQAKSADKK